MKTRSFLTALLAAFLLAPLTKLHAGDGFPKFSWDRVPVYAHFGYDPNLKPEQYDFLAKHFDALVWDGLGLDRHPELRDTYFGHYTEVVLYTQTTDPGVVEAGRRAAERLGLGFRHVHVGIDGLEAAIPVSFRALSARGSKE